MRNLLLKIAYNGEKYHGWQIQQNAVAVQEVFQKALYKVTGKESDLKGCSRTDSGVHAREFCLSLKTDSPIPSERMIAAINHYLPLDIAVLDCQEMPEDFHARYSCVGKMYRYEIWNNAVRDPFLENRALHYWYPLDVDVLQQAASYYVGTHDFSSFCTLDRREKGDLVRTITQAKVFREKEKVIFEVCGDGFLYNMVRIMVGTLLRVQQGKILPDDIGKIIEGKDRGLAGPTAPPEGLYLQKVFYKAEEMPNFEILPQ
ncbi:tRNA pseudouridine(38-40) synthase TruA [Scatolibacter rhodanostii]|uniref:tRNA pseudouridine(38-40) synthase TruA n=1 Tax=Scatolibacter rhodanostii TaxID=2014781 RepID=UPI000C07A900|nr:tRNA pseudouridine(38-40) synthase TruA [Scatolibacter rhodanostii]